MSPSGGSRGRLSVTRCPGPSPRRRQYSIDRSQENTRPEHRQNDDTFTSSGRRPEMSAPCERLPLTKFGCRSCQSEYFPSTTPKKEALPLCPKEVDLGKAFSQCC